MFIESAQDMLKTLDKWTRDDQKKELKFAVAGASDDFAAGYELGLQTARAILAGSPALVLKGVKPSDVL